MKKFIIIISLFILLTSCTTMEDVVTSKQENFSNIVLPEDFTIDTLISLVPDSFEVDDVKDNDIMASIIIGDPSIILLSYAKQLNTFNIIYYHTLNNGASLTRVKNVMNEYNDSHYFLQATVTDEDHFYIKYHLIIPPEGLTVDYLRFVFQTFMEEWKNCIWYLLEEDCIR